MNRQVLAQSITDEIKRLSFLAQNIQLRLDRLEGDFERLMRHKDKS
jgi:hypothetical protein